MEPNNELLDMLQGLPQDIVSEALEIEGLNNPRSLINDTELNYEIEEATYIDVTNEPQTEVGTFTVMAAPIEGPVIENVEEGSPLDYQVSFEQQLQEREQLLNTQIIQTNELRYSDAAWFQAAREYSSANYIVLIGAGGIGSWVGIILAKMGLSLYIFDGDSYDETNIAGQLFQLSQLNGNKAISLYRTCFQFATGMFLNANAQNFTSETDLPGPIVIAAVDNMEARLTAFTSWLTLYGSNPNALFIDGRLAAEHFQVYTVRGGDYRAQLHYCLDWFPSSQGEEEPCSFKQTSYMAAGIGHQICMNIASFFASISGHESIERPLPYFIETTPYYRVEEMFPNKPLSEKHQLLLTSVQNGEISPIMLLLNANRGG